VTPMRTRLGASANWTGSGMLRPQLRTSTLFSRDALVSGTSLSALHSVSYSQRIGAATEVFVTWSALCQDGGLAPGRCRPVMLVSLRRTLRAAPGLLARRGDIEGTVFQDDQGRGAYAPGMPVLAGVEVVLDGVRHTRTDRSGRFRFDGIPYGRHRVEARHRSNQPMFFTTPSPADVDTGSVVNFGIGRARSSLRGIIRTDAGSGVSRVLLHVAGGDRNSSTYSADDGTFIVEGLPAGDYEVSVDASTVPAGYAVDALAPQRVRVEETTVGRAAFVLRPYRTVSGRARLFNRQTGRYEALAGTSVELRPLKRRAVSDANGVYTFRDLPPGAYTIVAVHHGREYVASVNVPNGPAIVKDMDVAVLPDAVMPRPSAPRATAIASRSTTKINDGSGSSSAPRKMNGATASAAVSPAAAGAAFTIQVAASANARHARAMVDELKRAGHAAYLVEGTLSGTQGPYKVRVGRYSTLSEANRSALSLEKAIGWRLSITTVAQGS
jgi:cell division septation protein DedD